MKQTSQPNHAPRAPLRRSPAGLLVACLLAMAVFHPAEAAATDLTFGNPAVSGNGSPGTTALFTNVGTQDGVPIDMLATVIDATPGKIAYFSGINAGDFRFDIGPNSGDRFFKVRYQFFEAGTTTPRAITDMAWSIGDLDKTSGRTESVVVQGTSGYLAETETTLDINQSSYTISATGTVDLDENDPDGNPEGVISYRFENRAVLEITYQVQGGSGGYFDHVADGAFPFYSPTQTHLGVYYTFDILNDESVPVKMDFEDTLPGDFQWDGQFEPVVSGALADASTPDAASASLGGALNFSKGGRKAAFEEVSFPPGTTSFTLKTQSTSAVGEFFNEATTVASANSGFPQEEMMSTSTITLPDPGPVPPEGPVGTLVETFKENFCSYAWFILGGGGKTSGSATVGGDVGVGPGATIDVPASDIDGDIIKHPSEDLSDEVTAAIALAEDFAALPATQTFGRISGPTTIDATAADGVNIIRVSEIALSGDSILRLSGSTDDWFIVNVGNKFSLSGSARIIVAGVSASKVLFNVAPGVKVTLSGSSSAWPGTILAPASDLSLSSTTNVLGSVISGGSNQSLSAEARISGLANFGGSCN